MVAHLLWNAAMEHGATFDLDDDRSGDGRSAEALCDRSGWAWQEIAETEVALLWPLLTIAGSDLSMKAWQRLAERWLRLTGKGVGGLGAVRAASGAFVAIAGYRFTGADAARSMRLGFLRVLELGAEPLVLRAVLRAVARIARAKACEEVLILAEPSQHLGWAQDLRRWGPEMGAEGCSMGWRLPIGLGHNVVSLRAAGA